MNDHVAKPIDPRELFEALRTWIPPRVNAPAATPHADAPAVQVPPAAPITGPEVRVPQGIDGLDTTLGLQRVLGKVPRYLSMLEKYVAGQRSVVAELRRAMAAGDRDTATRLAHTTKGVSGNIGATAVQHLAGQLEQGLNGGLAMADLEPVLEAMAKRLGPLLQAIERQLPEAAPADPRAPLGVDKAQLVRVTQHLRELLQEMDSEAADWWADNARLLQSAFPAHAQAIEAAVRDFEFDRAIDQLDAA